MMPDRARLIRELSDRLLAATSATGALQRWCEERRLGVGTVSARRHGERLLPQPEPELLERLCATRTEAIWHRRVTLVRGEARLSEAENWFLPSRLRPEMRAALETTDAPFGAVIDPLLPSRRTYLVAFAEPGAEPCPHVLEHRAVVFAGSQPVAVVRERYRGELVREPP